MQSHPLAFSPCTRVLSLALCLALAASSSSCVAASAAPASAPALKSAGSYAGLVALFSEWRAAQRPPLLGGVPDYTPKAMEAQRQAVASLRQRLLEFEIKSWPVPQQVDWHVVRAELNGLDFDHRVLRPWAQNPAFYVTVFDEKTDQPAREGPFALGAVELWKLKFPLDAAAAKALEAGLSSIPPLLAQARGNLTGDKRDLWVYGAKALRQQEQILAKLSGELAAQPAPAAAAQPAPAAAAQPAPAAAAAAQRAREATSAFAAWVEEQSKGKTAPSGIGVENFDWYAANVQLVPWNHREQTVLMERELARAKATLLLEEQRNRALPPLVPVASAEEHARRFPPAVKAYVEFLRSHQVMTVRDYFEPALLAEIGHYNPKRPLEFFAESDYREPVAMRTHGYHWIDLAMMEREPNPDPIRRGALLYNLFDTRTEGNATAMEELMMHSGLFDQNPRARELIYVLVAQRAARALGELQMASNKLSLEEAARFAAAKTPRGWLRLEGGTVWFEQHLYLQQPGYGTSYLTGKLLLDQLLAAEGDRDGAAFSLRRHFDALNAAGLIPASLLLWELGGVLPEFKE